MVYMADILFTASRVRTQANKINKENWNNNRSEELRKRNNDSMQRIKDNNDETKDTNV